MGSTPKCEFDESAHAFAYLRVSDYFTRRALAKLGVKWDISELTDEDVACLTIVGATLNEMQDKK